MSWDPYLDLAAGVLRNRLGITDADELTRAETDFTSVRITQLLRHPLPGPYDLPHLQAFHRRIFGDAYDWAGELRTVSLGKGRLFCLPQHIVTFADDVFAKLACADHLRGRERPEFVDALTDLFADINALHPFREGNGRTQRSFLTQLAHDAGHPIRWAGMDPAVNGAASQAAHRGDNGPLRAMLDELVGDTAQARDVPGEPGSPTQAPATAQAPEAPAPRSPGDNEPRRRPGRGNSSA